MTKTELFELVANGANSGIEFRRDIIDDHALAEDIVAFANLQGGRVLLGVADDGTIAGITRDRLEEWVMTVCRDKIRPEIIPYFEVLKDVEPGKDVAVVTVERGWSVHCRWHDNRRSYYVRVGSKSREASPEELERLFQQRGAFRLEIRPVSGTSIEDLDIHRIRDYFERIRGQAIPGTDDIEGWQKLLVNTEFLVRQDERTPATIAGLLLFSQNPNKFLPQAGIDAAAYPGKEKDYAAKERSTIRGPLTPLFSHKNLLENGLVEQAIEFVRRNTGVSARLAGSARREESRPYPEEAVREAVVNALVHRDYLLSGTDIELSIYEDRLEVISPGKLPNGITPERMIAGCRASRNQLLKDVMRDYGYLEHMGMGVPRKIVKNMLEHNGTMPELIEDGERFIVRLLVGPGKLPGLKTL
jgi:ATP-dependent DNA helicase RecG